VQVFLPLLIGDTIGIAVVTPLVLRFVLLQRSIGLRGLLSIAITGTVRALLQNIYVRVSERHAHDLATVLALG
jgi:hypothetical protein